LNPVEQLDLRIEPSGVSLRNARLAVKEVLETGQARDLLNGTDHRVLHTDFLDTASFSGKATSHMVRAVVADYTNGRTIQLTGDAFEPPSSFVASVTNDQPHPSLEEVAKAAELAGFGRDAVAFLTMPPLYTEVFPNGTTHRILHIKARKKSETEYALFRANMNTGEAQRDSVESGYPLAACAAPKQGTGSLTPKGIPGQARVTISRGSEVLWTMEVLRPSISSGSDGSGVELLNVRYRGRTVLKRAHVPILNVEYKERHLNCGPTYRDWQNWEWSFFCDGTDVPGLQGFRKCTSRPKTLVDPPHTDGGNFNGVGFFVDGDEVTILSQIQAGWYRYTSEWRFKADGTILPRFGFAGVLSPNECVCVAHHHHVYWRLDFDIETASGNLVQEFNDPPLFGSTNYHDKAYEIQRPRDPSRKRHWEISNLRSGYKYALVPGPNDGAADAFGVGDLWVLKFHGESGNEELDDRPISSDRAQLEKFVTGEALRGEDVVLWYAAHFMHIESHPHAADEGGHVVGPDLKPLKWD